MISIASYMSTASTNNPYLNSNVIFNKNKFKNIKEAGKSNFNWDIDDDLREVNSSKEEGNEEIDILANRNDNSEDDIEFYTKLKTSHYLNNEFDQISKNFGSQVQQVI
jgi:hypothetical protein